MPIRMSFEMTTFEIELLGTENLILTHVRNRELSEHWNNGGSY